MIGPTGVGKTEIARRLAKMANAPFIKVEASKFTEVGYVGRDVESMIRDLTEIAVNKVRDEKMDECIEVAENIVEEKILDLLLPPLPSHQRVIVSEEGQSNLESAGEVSERLKSTREKMRKKLRDGELEDKLIEIEVSDRGGGVLGVISPGVGFEEMGIDLKEMMERMVPPKIKRKKVTVEEARAVLVEEEAQNLVDMDAVIRDAIERVEEVGIVFLDEIDKIVGSGTSSGPDVSREGVQRDILPIVEGATVFTKYGQVRTDHILFLAAGAFHGSKPSDLIPELQGRFPVRVELDPLMEKDLRRILVEPKNSLIIQYTALLGTEDLVLSFDEDAIDEIAHIAFLMNEQTENIGARRLYTIMEKLLEDISYEAPELKEKKQVITKKYVNDKLQNIIEDTDLSRYIL